MDLEAFRLAVYVEFGPGFVSRRYVQCLGLSRVRPEHPQNPMICLPKSLARYARVSPRRSCARGLAFSPDLCPIYIICLMFSSIALSFWTFASSSEIATLARDLCVFSEIATLCSAVCWRVVLSVQKAGTQRATSVNVQLLCLQKDLHTGSISRDIVTFPPNSAGASSIQACKHASMRTSGYAVRHSSMYASRHEPISCG